jgi:two-component system, response regulator
VNNHPILLVEDNPDDVVLTLRAFKKNNIPNEIVVVTDGAQALAVLLPEDAATPLRPALVLLDVKLPKINGLEVLRRLRDDPRTRSLPIVVLTTSSEESDIVTSYQFGANSFVRKPVVFSDFVSAASMFGMYWLLLNQPAPDWNSGGAA